jgi:hypothetical protein
LTQSGHQGLSPSLFPCYTLSVLRYVPVDGHAATGVYQPYR